MICSITDNNLGAFKNIIPVDFLEKFHSDEYYFLGAYKGKDKNTEAVGVLIFSVTIGESETLIPSEEELNNMSVEDLAAILEINDNDDTFSMIEWLYVDADHRKQGYASELLNAYFDLIEELQILSAICDVPEGEDFDALVLVLEKFGFEFEYIDKFCLDTSIGELSELKALKQYQKNNVSINNIQFLKNLDRNYFNEAIKLIETESHTPLTLHYDFIEDITGYDLDLSCVMLIGDKIIGAFLVRALPSGKLFPIALRGFDKDDEANCLNMLLASMDKACKTYPKDKEIYVDCVNDRCAKLICLLMPDAVAKVVRRGVSIAYEEV